MMDRTIYITTPASSSFCVIIIAGSVRTYHKHRNQYDAAATLWSTFFVSQFFSPGYRFIGVVLRGACARILYILQGWACYVCVYPIYIEGVFMNI